MLSNLKCRYFCHVVKNELFTNDKIFDAVKLRGFADDEINFTQMFPFVFDRVANNVGRKRRKCWLLVPSPFSTMFLKGCFVRVVGSRNCLVNNYSGCQTN